jgi:hypothetical protein
MPICNQYGENIGNSINESNINNEKNIKWRQRRNQYERSGSEKTTEKVISKCNQQASASMKCNEIAMALKISSNIRKAAK